MPHVSEFPPGALCFAELHTTDRQAATSFYTDLFGWTTNEVEMGGPIGGKVQVYVMLQKDGRDAAALYEQTPSQRKESPPMWLTYFATDSADRIASRVRQLGGTLLMDPFDVFDIGRMAVVQDPQGAVFAVWQAKSGIGAAVVDEPASICWTELHTSDVASAKTFYTSLFNWQTKDSAEYVEWMNAGRAVGGMMAQTPEEEGIPPNWLIYFAVEDCDATAARAKARGGQVFVEPQDIPNVGRFAVIADPQGAAFAVVKLTA